MTEEKKEKEVKGRVEEVEVSGDKLLDTIKDLLRQVNIRRITIKTHEGETLFEVPLVLGTAGIVAGMIWAPIWTTIVGIAALVTRLKIVIERVE